MTMTPRITPPDAEKRRDFGPIRVPLPPGLRTLFGTDDHATPAREAARTRIGTGLEAPEVDVVAPPNHLERAFLFVDISGFTAYVEQAGEHAALALLEQFRRIVREVAARRGVRVGKWLGDGVMLVAPEPAVVIAAAGELMCRFAGTGIDIHAGMAFGPVLLFEGDDYIGRPVNLAARLCDAAGAEEFLAVVHPSELPEWVSVAGSITVRVHGLGDVTGVSQLVVNDTVRAGFESAA